MIDAVIDGIIADGLSVLQHTACMRNVGLLGYHFTVSAAFNEHRVFIEEIHGFESIFGRIGQIESLRPLSRSKEGGITFRRSLYHFVFGREKIHGIFARSDIRPDDDTFLLEIGIGFADMLMEGVACQVFRVMYYLSGVIAL